MSAADSDSTNNEILCQLEKLSKEQELISNYLVTLNEYILRTNFGSTQIFPNSINALQTGQELMKERIKQITNVTLRASKEKNIHEKEEAAIKKRNDDSEELEFSNIFAKFPHSALMTPLPSCSSSLSDENEMNKKATTTAESSTTSTSSSLCDLYEKLSTVNGKAVFTRNFVSLLKSPNVSTVDESRNSSRMDISTLSSTFSTPIGKRHGHSTTDDSKRSRRAAAPASLKEPSLKKKMRRA